MHFLEELNENQQRWYLRYLAGETVTQIAESESVPQSTLSTNLKKIRAIVRDRFSSKVQEMKESTSESLQWKIRELHRAWQRSKLPTVQLKFKKVVHRQGSGSPMESDPEFADDEQWTDWECERVVTERLPDVRFLAEARNCEQMLGDWWGYGTSDPRNKDDDDNENGMTDTDIVERDLRSAAAELGPERAAEILASAAETGATE